MSPEEIFSIALDKDPVHERQAFLDEACAGDTSLRAEVESLLKAHENAGSFLVEPVAEWTDQFNSAMESPQPELQPGTWIGPYKLLQEIGRGGMGVVYVAEQLEPVQRKVALKLIKSTFATGNVIARFEAERQALAIMDHPNIAHVIDAGTTADGQPWFVMELVKGLPITEYCDQARLEPRQRLELMIQVCQAVQHAHQKGIIHRDLKPSNVLVTEYDGRPVPKIIDFGVAKAINVPLTEQTLNTDFGAVVGTLEYMSPEQAGLNQLDIDTRSDVYSLGVLIYELLTGSTPFNRAQLGEAAIFEALRLIREVEPQKPSTRISSTDQAPSVAARRSTEPARLCGLVRGELDWISMKALDKDRSRRYQTANDVAADLRRFLDNEPVLAGPPSTVYRLRKFLGRNRLAASLSALGILALAGGATGTTIGMLNAQHQRNQKELALNEVQIKNAETTKALAAEQQARAAADVATDRAVTALQTLTDESVDRLLTAQPELTTANREFLNQIVSQLAEFTRATDNSSRARVVQADGLNQIGNLKAAIGDYGGAVAAFRESIAIWEPLCEERQDKHEYRRGMGDAWSNLGIYLAVQKQFVDSEAAHRKAIEIHDALVSQFPENTSYQINAANVRNSFGVMLKDVKRNAETMIQYEEALKIFQRLITIQSTDSSILRKMNDVQNNYAIELALAGRMNDSLAAHQVLITHRRRLIEGSDVSPRDRYVLAMTMVNFAMVLQQASKNNEAIEQIEDAEPFISQAVAEAPVVVEYRSGYSQLLGQLATAYSRQKQYESCVQVCDRAVAILNQLSREYPENAAYPAQRGRLLSLQGNAHEKLEHQDLELKSFNSAIEATRQALRLDAENVDYQFLLANQLAKLGAAIDKGGVSEEAKQIRDEARTILEQLIIKDPANARYSALLDAVLRDRENQQQ